MSQKKTLFIMHFTPPIHGASKVGDMIVNSQSIKDAFKAKFIKIKSSDHLSQINKFNSVKLFYFIELFFRTCKLLLTFRPSIIYFTVSPFGFAFYRDLMLSLPIKTYVYFTSCEIYYHYHQEGINRFTSIKRNKILTEFFVNNVNLIFISEAMKSEVERINSYKSIYYLKNGVEDLTGYSNEKDFLEKKLSKEKINVLYLSSMIKEKGFIEVLKLATLIKNKQIKHISFNMAGAWFSKNDESYFYSFIKKNNLETIVSYKGFVSGEVKNDLFRNSHMLIYPSTKDVFPLTIIESLSYGTPVLSYNVGAISEIINSQTGKLTNPANLYDDFFFFIDNYLNEKTYINCRNAFLENFTVKSFENELISILNN